MPPVVIVGAGPTGLAAALELTRQGAPVRILDRATSANTESRGTGLQARTLELLDLYGVTDDILARSHRANAFISYRNGVERGRIDFTLAPSRRAGSPVIPQAITETVLRDRLAAQGVAVEFGCEVVSVSDSDAGCLVTIRSEIGDERTIPAGWVIAADGARSPIRTLLDLPFDGVSYPEGWGLMDAALDWPWVGDAVRVFRGDGPQQFVVVPLGPDLYRLQLDHREDALQGEPPEVEEMQAAFDRYVPVAGRISAPRWRSSFRVHRRQVVAYRHGHILLAGDAAHIHTPAGAQGLNTGIQDGINLGWKLGLVVRGQAHPALLDTYQEERKPIAAGVLQLAEVLARNPDAMLGDGTVPPEAIAARVSQLMVNYRDGPLGQGGVAPGGACRVCAGDRVPDLLLDDGPLYRHLAAPGLTVVVAGRPEGSTQFLAVWGDAVRLLPIDPIDTDGAFVTATGLDIGAAVIRPDAYFGCVIRGDTPFDAIDAWLRRGLGLEPQAVLDAAAVVDHHGQF